MLQMEGKTQILPLDIWKILNFCLGKFAKKPGHLVNRIPRASIYYVFLFKSLSIKLTIFRRGGGDICCHSCHEM